MRQGDPPPRSAAPMKLCLAYDATAPAEGAVQMIRFLAKERVHRIPSPPRLYVIAYAVATSRSRVRWVCFC